MRPSHFLFLCVYGPRRSRGLLYGFRGNYSCEIERVVPLNLARSGSQSHRAIWFISLTRGASHVIKIVIVIVIVIAIVIYATKAHLKGNTIQKERNEKRNKNENAKLEK